MQEKLDNVNPLDIYSAVKEMKETRGWKLLMDRYAREGDELLTAILNVNLPLDFKYSLRDLYVFQLNALGRLSKIIENIEIDAKVYDVEQREKKHIGV